MAARLDNTTSMMAVMMVMQAEFGLPHRVENRDGSAAQACRLSRRVECTVQRRALLKRVDEAPKESEGEDRADNGNPPSTPMGGYCLPPS